MIVKMTGILGEVGDQWITLERDGLCHEVLVPGYALAELAAHRGSEIVLHTLEFMEASSANGNLVPRMIGFLHTEDRAFFLRFIAVKGIGARKALKALSEPVARIAAWIQHGEAPLLAKLPGIGKRGAEMIVAELRGKVDQFAMAAAPASSAGDLKQSQRDALEVMLAWGDSRADALRWLERAAQVQPDLNRAEDWIRACYRIKAGGAG